jgi:hypothetical protein
MFSLLEKKVVSLMGHCAIQLLKMNKRTKIIKSHYSYTECSSNMFLFCNCCLCVILYKLYEFIKVTEFHLPPF